MLIFVFPPLYGEGYPNILNILHADYGHLFNYTPLSYLVMNKYGVLIMAAALMLTKVFATMFTIGGGGNGGMFGSSLFAGSFLGLLFVEGLRIMGIAELDHVQFIVVAMAGLLNSDILDSRNHRRLYAIRSVDDSICIELFCYQILRTIFCLHSQISN
jgi:CIC family chloride channel protein